MRSNKGEFMIRITTALRSSVAIAAIAGGVTAAQAQSTLPPPDVSQTPATQAQSAAAPSGEIVITGSRIRRNPLDLDAPRVFVDQQDIAKTGLNSINDVLQRLPSSGGGLNSKFNNSGNLGNPPDGGGVGAGAAEIDLRYLGSRRTLVLVDGLRFVNGASASGVPGSVDLNAIPESMIERVEVLQDGASAIYGSDAIAGVVNIITKRKQKGFIAQAQVGQYLKEGDGTTQNYQVSWGNGDSHRLSLVAGANYVKQGAISSADRAISAFPNPYSTSCLQGGCSAFLPNGLFEIFGPDANHRPDLTLIAPVIGRVATPADFRDALIASSGPGAADRFNFAPFNFLQIPLKRYGAFADLNYELADNLHNSVKALWNKRKSANQAAPLPFGIGPQAGITPVLDATTIDVTNPFNPFGVTLDASNMNVILRRFVEGGPRRFFQTVDTVYLVDTFDGNFGLMGHDWYWDINGIYGHNLAKQTMLGNINSANLRQALGPVDQCVGQKDIFNEKTCTPFNFFGGAGSITPDMLDFVTFTQHDRSEQTLWDFTGNISGEVVNLPGGPLGLATGLEYRDNTGRFDPDPKVAAGFSSDIPAQPTKGGFNVKEAYAELNAPIMKGMTGIDLLELNGAVRYSKYHTDSGRGFSHTTFKASGNYKPIHDLRFRASWAQGFRAPSIGELFGTQSRFDQTISDPCSNDSTAAQNINNSTTVFNNCVAHGVPADKSYAQANPQISVIVGGNEDLKPETSKSLVFGGVFSPSFLPGFSVEANHYKIKIKGAIQPVDAKVTLNNCEVLNDPAACALVTRVGGALTQITGTLVNIAGINTKGTDLNVAYHSRKTGLGRFGLTWNNTFLHSFDEIIPVTGGTQTNSLEGTERGSPSQGFPKWKSIGILDWDGTALGASLTGRYVSKLREKVTPAHTMGAKFYTDLQLRYAPTTGVASHFAFAVGANNLLNTKAPGCITCDINNFDPTMYDIPGRYYYARLTAKY